MLLKGPRSHTSSITPFTSSRLVIHGVYCKGIAPNTVSYISVTTYFYIYLAGDLIWTVLLGEWDSTPTSWLYQQPPTTTSTSRERSTTRRRLQQLLVGFDFDWLGSSTIVGDYLTSWRRHGDTLATTSTTRFAYKTTPNRLCSATRWQLLRLLVSPTKLVGINSARWHAGDYFDYSFRLQN
jgi:hypothetical protein